ncbi:nucleotidyltransferase substrate binding protein [Thiotrichales bacterium 19S9-12]|nr:nucleotidyltransferase substrate binding protein [Thiotrichales bacterium 19S9-11]MCF6812187.1 nucleotidyltransferase substrate binding protein [Thiotrichales bacterium 19S9-12]
MSKPRWIYRFDNYSKAFKLLKKAIEKKQQSGLTELEEEGVIQRFEYTIELAWKTMKDYLEHENIVLEQITPRAVIRQAFSSKLIDDGATWQNALDDRNRMSHTYDIEEFEVVVNRIQDKYLSRFEQLYDKLQSLIEKI